MSKLALGTVQFGLDYGISNTQGQVLPTEVANILEFAQAHNIDTLDTASAYGTSETILGATLKQTKHNFQIVTKVIPNNQTLTDHVTQSLDKLQQGSLFAVMLHNAEDLLGRFGDRYFDQLKELKARGLVQKIGVSLYSLEQFFQIHERYDVDIVQVPMNIFDQRFCSPTFKQIVEQNQIEVHARSIFLQGLLLMSAHEWPAHFAPFKAPLTEFQNFIELKQCSAVAACVSFVKAQEHVTKLVVGVNSKAQLQEIVNSYMSSNNYDFSGFSQVNEQLINPANWP